jgi:hypothetical protein
MQRTRAGDRGRSRGSDASLHELGREKRLNARRDDAVNCLIDKLSVASYTGGADAASSDRSDGERAVLGRRGSRAAHRPLPGGVERCSESG